MFSGLVINPPITLDKLPGDIAYYPENRMMFVLTGAGGSINPGKVFVIDTAANNVIGTSISLRERTPIGIAYEPVNRRMYVTNFSSDTVFVIDIGSNAQRICAKENIQHWEKIVFKVTSVHIASSANLPVDSELDIKVLDNPKEVSD